MGVDSVHHFASYDPKKLQSGAVAEPRLVFHLFIITHIVCGASVCGQEALLSERLNCGRWLREQTD